MKADFVVTTYLEKKMGFLFEDQILTEAHFFSREAEIGSICTATVDKVVPTVDAAFLTGPEGQVFFYPLKENEGRHIFLRNREEKRRTGLRPGDVLLVQVIAEAQKKKQAAATSRISLTSDMVIVNRTGQVGTSKKITDPDRKEALKMLLKEILSEQAAEEFGAIARTAAEHSSDDNLREVTIKLLCELKMVLKAAETTPEHRWIYHAGKTPEEYARLLKGKGIYESVTVHTDLPWEEGADGGYGLHVMTPADGSPLVIFNIPVLLERALARKVYLKSGGYLYVESTEAMTVIDVNSGKNIRGKDHETGALEQNLEAAREIGRLLRLRNISGIIMIDFINMKRSENERRMLSELRSCTANDHCRVHVVDITKLGIVEVTREKKAPPLSEQLGE